MLKLNANQKTNLDKIRNLIPDNMKKVILLLTIQFIVASSIFSQDQNSKAFVAINIGTSLPTGNFASTDFDEAEAAYANNGVVLDISFNYKFHPKLGVTAVWRGQGNSIDVGNYAQDLANYFGSGYPAGNTSVSVETSAYSLGGIMAGLSGSFPIADQLYFEPKALIGFSAATLPEMTTKSYYNGILLTTFTRDKAETTTFSYIIGAGAKLDVSNSICLLFNLDYYSAKAIWENVRMIGIGHITGDTDIKGYDYEYTFRTLNITGGLGFRF
jgi:hypothetical protein